MFKHWWERMFGMGVRAEIQAAKAAQVEALTRNRLAKSRNEKARQAMDRIAAQAWRMAGQDPPDGDTGK